MPLDLGSHVEDGRAIKVARLRKGRSRGDTGHDGLSGRAHAASLRNTVGRLQRETETAQTKSGTGTAEGGDHQMGLVARQCIGAFTVDNHVSDAVVRIIVKRERELIVIVERQAHGVKAGTKVGGGGGHTHMDSVTDWIHSCSFGAELPSVSLRSAGD